MRTVLTDRSGNAVNAGYVRLEVESMAWADEGGPARATVKALGSLPALCLLLGYLRFGVKILDDVNGAAAWWGFVNAVEIHTAGIVYQVSLDSMWNRVAVRYREENPLSGDSASWQYQSSWVEDAGSVAMFGAKEQTFSLGESRADQAAAAAATYLTRLKYPGSRSNAEPLRESSWAELLCLGWWETLQWQYYSQTRGYVGNVQTAVGGVNYPFGAAAAASQLEQPFVVTGSAAWSARWLWVKMYRFGAPADNVTADILTAPSAGQVSVLTVTGSTISKDSASWYVFDLPPVSLTNGTTYYFRLRRSGAVDANNYYGVKVEENALLGSVTAWNGAAWVARVPAASMIMGYFGQESNLVQIAAMAAAGQFLRGTLIKTGTGILTRLFRGGKNRIQAELLDLARSGYSTNEGMRLSVNADRQLVAELRPARSVVDLLITSAGEIRHYSGRALTGGENPVGKWALVQGLAVLGGTAGNVQAVVYVDRAEWVRGKLRVEWETGL